jgi:putative tryptophan/tyrosine transport system substrate-binding protein
MGFVEERNVALLFRLAENGYDQLPALAADLVDRKVSVIIAPAPTNAALAAKAATATIPIVFLTPSDPVAVGLVPNLKQPGGNITGVTFLTEQLNQSVLNFCTKRCLQRRRSAISSIRPRSMTAELDACKQPHKLLG